MNKGDAQASSNKSMEKIPNYSLASRLLVCGLIEPNQDIHILRQLEASL